MTEAGEGMADEEKMKKSRNGKGQKRLRRGDRENWGWGSGHGGDELYMLYLIDLFYIKKEF